MSPFRMKYLCALLLLLCGTQEAKTAIPFPVADPKLIRGVVGYDLILPCYLKNNLSAVDMEVAWLIGSNSIVHHFKQHQDVTDRQLLQYHHRTSLFREELQRGNVSLKLTNVSISDTNRYRCYVAGQHGSNEDALEVQVNEFGGDPLISAVSHVNGSATLMCETSNWSHTTDPTLEWLDSKGDVLQNISISYLYFIKTIFNMQAKVTVQEKANNSYTCRVSYLGHRRQNRDPFEVKRRFFEKQRLRGCFFLVLLILVILLIWLTTRFRKNSQTRVLQRYRAISTDLPVVETAPKTNQNPTDRPIHLPTDQTDGSTDTVQHRITRLRKNKRKFVIGNCYTELLIVGGHREFRTGKEPHKKRDYQETGVEKLLTQDAHNLVILQGESGYGKSSTAKKILHDWQFESSYLKHYDLVFLLKCDELSTLSEQKSLLDLVSRNLKKKYKNLIEKYMDRSPSKILIVIDGLDELSLSEEDAKESPNDPFTPAPSKAVVGGLLSGRILPAASMLVTTRPSAAATVETLRRFRPWKFAQILGFTQEAVTKYCSVYFEENSDLYGSLKDKQTLFTSCSSPMLCWIICEAIKKGEASRKNTVELETTTSVYLAFFGDFLKSLSLGQRNQLFRQAKEIIEGKNVKLDLRNIPALGDGDPFRCSGQQKMPFMHRSFLEFFASLSYTMLDDDEAERLCEELLIAANRPLLPQSPWHGDTLLVLKFLFGLSNKDINSFVQNILSGHEDTIEPSSPSLSLPSSSAQLLPQLKHWVLDRSSEPPIREDCLFILQCLYELQDDVIVKEAMSRMKDVRLLYTPLTPTDCCVLQYCLMAFPSIKLLDLRYCNLTSEKVKLLEPVWKTLQCDDLRLTAEGLGYTDIDDLMERIFPSPSEQSEETQDRGGTTKIISLRFVKSSLQGHDMKILTEEKLPRVLKTSQSRNISSNVSIEVDKSIESGGVYYSFSGETSDDIFQLNVEFWKPEPRDGQRADPEVLSISLTLPPSQLSETDWKDFLQETHRQRRDRCVVEHLCSLPELRKLEVQVTHLTVDWASDILYRLHGCPSLQEVKINAADGSTQGHCTFSRFTLKRDNDISLSVEDSSNEKTAYITLPTEEASSQEKSTELLNNVLKLKNREDQEKSVTALLSMQVAEANANLFVNCITASLAETVLSFNNDMNVSIRTNNHRDKDTICTLFKVKKDSSCFNLQIRDAKVSSSAYTAPVVSGIHLESETTPVKMDWKLLLTSFQTLHTLRNSNPEVDVHLDTLLSYLYGQRDLNLVDLYVSYWSDGLKNNIQSLKETCPNLVVRVSCGYNTPYEGDTMWVGEEDGESFWTWTSEKENPLAES